MRRFFWKHFPIFYMLPFIMATMQFRQIAAIGEVLRWAILGIGCVMAINSRYGRAGSKYKYNILTKTDIVIIVFLLIFLASEFWTIHLWYTAQRAISMVLLYGCSFWTLWEYADYFSEKILIHKFLNTLAVIFSINLLSSFFISGAWFTGRFRGVFVNPNNIGLILGLSIPLAVFQWLINRQRLSLAILCILLTNLVACGTRSAMLGVTIATVAILISMFAKNPYKVITIFGLTISIFFLILFLQTDFFVNYILREDSLVTASNRTYFWELAKTYIANRPNFGHGFGTELVIHKYYGIVLQNLNLRGYGVMSSYYGLAVQIGLPLTYVFFGLLWGFILFNFVKYWSDYQLVSLLAPLASGLIICIFESSLYSAGSIFSFLFWCILMLAVRRKQYQKYKLMSIV